MLCDLQTMSHPSNKRYEEYNGGTLVHMACKRHQSDNNEVLLSVGGNPNIQDDRGYFPIEYLLIDPIPININRPLQYVPWYKLLQSQNEEK